MLRTARALLEAKIPAERIRRSLENLRRDLPGLGAALGPGHQRGRRSRRGARRRQARWQVESGQYVLGLDVSVRERRAARGGAQGSRRRPPPQPRRATGSPQALALESTDPRTRRSPPTAQAVAADPGNVAAWTNWGRLLHEHGRTQEAADVYRARARPGRRRCAAALQSGRAARGSRRRGRGARGVPGARWRKTRTLPTATTTSRGCTSRMGKPQHAIRHLGQYRRLVSSESR